MPGGAKPWPGSDGVPGRREISRQMQSAQAKLSIRRQPPDAPNVPACLPPCYGWRRRAVSHRHNGFAAAKNSVDKCQRDQPAPRPLGRQTQQMGCRPSPMARSSFSAQ